MVVDIEAVLVDDANASGGFVVKEVCDMLGVGIIAEVEIVVSKVDESLVLLFSVLFDVTAFSVVGTFPLSASELDDCNCGDCDFVKVDCVSPTASVPASTTVCFCTVGSVLSELQMVCVTGCASSFIQFCIFIPMSILLFATGSESADDAVG